MKKGLFYAALLIGTYLVVANSTGAGRLISASGTSGSLLVKTLQGR